MFIVCPNPRISSFSKESGSFQWEDNNFGARVIHSLNKDLLSNMLGTVLGARDTAMNETDSVPGLKVWRER